MRTSGLMSLCLFGLAAVHSPAASSGGGVYDYTLPGADGTAVSLAQFKGKITLLVNIGTKTEYAAQLAALEALYQRFSSQGLVVLAVPSTNFADLTTGSDAEIQAFCREKYKVTFPVVGKTSVRGDDQAALYHYLTEDAGKDFKGDVHWAFTKFVVGKDGRVLFRFEPGVAPDDPALVLAIEQAISGKLPKKKDESDKPASSSDSRRSV
jgi:glutathione peroxidase